VLNQLGILEVLARQKAIDLLLGQLMVVNIEPHAKSLGNGVGEGEAGALLLRSEAFAHADEEVAVGAPLAVLGGFGGIGQVARQVLIRKVP